MLIEKLQKQKRRALFWLQKLQINGKRNRKQSYREVRRRLKER
jgi:hypothetical protein